jgi:tetratricopeptide (TPR) repeat protein
MTEAALLDSECFQTTDGEIAIINLNSARLRSWSRFDQDPQRPGVAEAVLEHEQLTAQFVGDLSAFGRMESLAEQLAKLDSSSLRTALIQAQVASALHRFSDARHYLAQASLGGAPTDDVRNLLLNLDQACGRNFDKVLDARRQIANRSNRLEDLVALGSLLADMQEWDEADSTYRLAVRSYQDVSPFPLAWACFQLGALWGEFVPEPKRSRATEWYQKAVDVLPSYAKARVHLAEMYLSDGRLNDAEALLRPIIGTGDPEVNWRLADVLSAQGKPEDAEAQMEVARSGFEGLLGRYLLAFADHGAEFYAGSGNDCDRALKLARTNVANRPTLRALDQAHQIANLAGNAEVASELLSRIRKKWGHPAATKHIVADFNRMNTQGVAI